MEVKCHEGKTVCKADLREVQDHPPQGQGYGYLPEPEAQAEAGLNPYRGYPIPPIYERKFQWKLSFDTPGRRPGRLGRGIKSTGEARAFDENGMAVFGLKCAGRRECVKREIPFPDKLPRVMARDDGLREHDKHAL